MSRSIAYLTSRTGGLSEPLPAALSALIIRMQGDRGDRSERSRSERAASQARPQPGAGSASSTGGDPGTTPATVPGETLRVLIPIDATDRSRWPIRHTLARHHAGIVQKVHLLHVAEPVVDWQVLRFRTQAEMARFHAMRAEFLLEDAARPLREAGVEVAMHFREGDIASQIVDAAEQFGCRAILLPPPYPGWRRLFARDIVREVMGRTTSARVDIVDDAGTLRHALGASR